MKKSIKLMVAVVGLAASFEGAAFTYFYNSTSNDVKILPIKNYNTSPSVLGLYSVDLKSTNTAKGIAGTAQFAPAKVVKYVDSSVPAIAYVVESANPAARFAIYRKAGAWHALRLQSTSPNLQSIVRSSDSAALVSSFASKEGTRLTTVDNIVFVIKFDGGNMTIAGMTVYNFGGKYNTVSLTGMTETHIR